MTHEPIEIWISSGEDDATKVSLFNEAVRQGRIVVYWESYYDDLTEVIALNEEIDDGTE